MPPAPPPGAYPLTATYDGDDKFATSTSTAVTQTVNKGATTLERERNAQSEQAGPGGEPEGHGREGRAGDADAGRNA